MSSNPQTTKLSKVGRRFSTCVPSISLTTTVSLDTKSSEPPVVDLVPLRRTSSHKYATTSSNAGTPRRGIRSPVSNTSQDTDQDFSVRSITATRQRKMSRNHLTINWSEGQASQIRKSGSSSFDCGGGTPCGGGSIAAASTLGSSMLLLPQGTVQSRRKSFIHQVPKDLYLKRLIKNGTSYFNFNSGSMQRI